MKNFILSMFLILTLPLAGNAQYDRDEEDEKYERISGFHEHDGFFLRFHAGVGAAEMVEKEIPISDLTLSGTSGVFRFQIGGSIADNLILFGELGGFSVTNPEAEYGEYSDALSDVELQITDYGGGLTYYFMPSNIYVSGTITLSKNRLNVRALEVTGETEMGYGAYLSAGKEWWVSGDWALGVAGFYYFSEVTDKDVGGTEYPVSNTVFGVVFSATYH